MSQFIRVIDAPRCDAYLPILTPGNSNKLAQTFSRAEHLRFVASLPVGLNHILTILAQAASTEPLTS